MSVLDSDDTAKVILKLNNNEVVEDFIFLLDHKDNWSILDSIYDEVDVTTQYDYYLNKKCENKKLNKNILIRIALPFRFFLNILIQEFITIQEFRTTIEKSIQHENRDEFLEFMAKVYTNRKLVINKLYKTRELLDQFEHSILKDFSIIKCNTNMQFHDELVDIPFVLLQISDKTYRCTVNDIKIIMDKLNKAIEGDANIE